MTPELKPYSRLPKPPPQIQRNNISFPPTPFTCSIESGTTTPLCRASLTANSLSSVIVCTTVANLAASLKRKARTYSVAAVRTDKYSHSALGPLGSRRSDCLGHPSPQLDDLICIVLHDETEHKELENHNLAVVREAPKHVCGSECRQQMPWVLLPLVLDY